MNIRSHACWEGRRVKREKWIDTAKGIAILLVIIGHSSNDLVGIWDFRFVYGIHLVMFFLLSGYTLRKAELTREFLNKKFRRLMVPYFYTCGAVLLTDILNSRILNHNISIQRITGIISLDLLRSFFASGSYTEFGAVKIGSRIGAIWFLPALFFAILIFELMLRRVNNDKLLGIYTGFLAVLGVITARFLWLPFSIQSGMLATFFLWIGYEIREREVLSKIRWYHYFTAQIILLFGIAHGYCGIAFVRAELNDLLISIPVGLSGCLLIYLLSVKNKRGIILPYLGKNSLTILCTHLYALETMRTYFDRLLNRMRLSGNAKFWGLILLEIGFACLSAVGIDWLKKTIFEPREGFLACFRRKLQHSIKQSGDGRNPEIDIAKGIFICAMLVGHFAIERRLRTIIYSCHMIAFVFFSGYFYKSGQPYGQTLKKMSGKLLLPYVISAVGAMILNAGNWSGDYFRTTIITYVLGMSFSKKVLSGIGSVGPVYFLLLLFLTKLMYMTIDRFVKDRKQLTALVFLISVLGVTLGQEGWWLPWSFDIACYAIAFYHAGRICREYRLLEITRNWSIAYFVLAPVWAYMIYCGDMEIAVRKYGNYGIVVLGAVSGVLVVYQFSTFISNNWPMIARLFMYIGKSTIIVLIIHTLLGTTIGNFVALRFNRDYSAFMAGSILLQLIISVVLSIAIEKTKKRQFAKSQ